jgi:hypothetical protein
VNDFLNPTRMRAWCIILAVAMALWALLAIAEAALGIGDAGDGLGLDFTCFHAAGVLAAKGMATAVYHPAAMAAAQNAERALPHGQFYPFLYPPTYLLLCLPLAWLPYWPALVVFLLAGLVPLVLALRRLEPPAFGWLPILAFPGVLLNAGSGQNGFLTAACFAGFMLFADPRPYLAGACLGLLACKPHLAVLAPVVLLAAGRWRSLAGAAATFAVMASVSLLVFGLAEWTTFLAGASDATRTINGGMITQAKIQSAFIAVRLLGGSLTLAAIVQGVVAAVAVAAVIQFVRRRPGGAAEGAALAAASLLATPYLADYDLACLAPPLAVAAARGVRAGWGRYDKLLLLAAYLLPLFARGVAARTGVQIAPLVMAGLLLVLVTPKPDAHAAS